MKGAKFEPFRCLWCQNEGSNYNSDITKRNPEKTLELSKIDF